MGLEIKDMQDKQAMAARLPTYAVKNKVARMFLSMAMILGWLSCIGNLALLVIMIVSWASVVDRLPFAINEKTGLFLACCTISSFFFSGAFSVLCLTVANLKSSAIAWEGQPTEEPAADNSK